MGDVRIEGIADARPGRESTTGANILGNGDVRAGGAARRRNRDESMVPPAEFTSYYGRPVLKEPTWKAHYIANYFFLGGLAGASSVVAALAQLTGRPALARATKVGSTVAGGLSLAALVSDLGRPSRFINMLRVFKPTSPMSVGSWLLAGYVPASAAATASDVTGRLPVAGALATGGAAVLGPAVASYTAALVSNTAVPAWHDGRKELPFVFVASSAAAAAGLGLFAAPGEEVGPVRFLGAVAAPAEAAASILMERRMGLAGESYKRGRADRYRKAAGVLLLTGAIGSVAARRHALLTRLAGAALMAGSVMSRFAIFEAGVESARDPKYTIVPQRERVDDESR